MKKILLGLWVFFSICLAVGDPTQGTSLLGYLGWFIFCGINALIASKLLKVEYEKHPDDEQV